MALDLSRLQAAVAHQTTVTASAITLITDLAQRLRDAAGDPAAVMALADALEAEATKLADAVTANTPSA